MKFPSWFLMLIGGLIAGTWTLVTIASTIWGKPVDPYLNLIMLGLGGALFGRGFIRHQNGE